jgi:predicted glycosyl hydrolase (DUF1957 family)
VSESCVEYVSDVSSIYMAPSTVAASESESVMKRNLHFLARELELEKQNRARLSKELQEMKALILKQREEAMKETETYLKDKTIRETGPPLDLDVTKETNLNHGFIDLSLM